MIFKCGCGGVEFRWEGDDGQGGRKARDEMWVHVEGEEEGGI